MSSIKILFPDQINFHSRNFKSLFDFIDEFEIQHQFITNHDKDLKLCFGNYVNNKDILDKYYNILSIIDNEQDLFSYHHKISNHDISVFPLVKSETLSFILPNNEKFYGNNLSGKDRDIFSKLYKYERETLLLNMSAAMFWIDFWQNIVNENFNEYSHCCIFSGHTIYSKALQKVLSYTKTKVMVMESLFTGHDYFCEESYSHIANNSNIANNNYYRALDKIFDEGFISKKFYDNRNIAYEKLENMRNKNVIQPVKSNNKITFNNNNETILILGQVINDSSIIDNYSKNINILSFYKDLIQNIIDNTSYNIIFKSHPYEKKKVNVKRQFIFEEITKFTKDFKGVEQRFIIVDDYNIYDIFDQSNIIVSYCSQSCIEASLRGFKTVQFGRAFFGNKGFTHDFKDNEITNFIDQLKKNNISGLLTFDEFKKFEQFLVKLLQFSTISNCNINTNSLHDKFFKNKIVSDNNSFKKRNNLNDSNQHICLNKDELFKNPFYIIKALYKTISSDINPRTNKIMKFRLYHCLFKPKLLSIIFKDKLYIKK